MICCYVSSRGDSLGDIVDADDGVEAMLPPESSGWMVLFELGTE